MTSQQSTDQNLPTRYIFVPAKGYPEVSEGWVSMIFSWKLNSLDLVACRLPPLYGFGSRSQENIFACINAQALFASQVMREPFGEFAVLYLKGEWGFSRIGMPDWNSTMALVKEHAEDDAWIGDKCPVSDGASVNEFYARLLIRTTQRLKYQEKDNRRLDWLRAGDYEDQCWVLFFSLAYLQFEAMDFNKDHASFRDLVSRYNNKTADIGSFFDEIPKLMGLRDKKE